MGCIIEEKVEVTPDALKVELRKLKYMVDILKQRLDKEKLKGDQFLYNEVSKEKHQRSRQLERVIIQGNARFQNQKNSNTMLTQSTASSKTKPILSCSTPTSSTTKNC